MVQPAAHAALVDFPESVETLCALLVAQEKVECLCRPQVVVPALFGQVLLVVDATLMAACLGICSSLLCRLEEEGHLEVVVCSAQVASRHQAAACSHLVVPDQVVDESAHLDHCTAALHRFCPVAPQPLVRVRPADSHLRVPSKGKWSTESGRNHLSRKQPAEQTRCGVAGTVHHVAT